MNEDRIVYNEFLSILVVFSLMLECWQEDTLCVKVRFFRRKSFLTALFRVSSVILTFFFFREGFIIAANEVEFGDFGLI
jgi:hypothetical protein